MASITAKHVHHPRARPGFWHRRVVAPLRAELVRGARSGELAFTVAVAVACSVLPFWGLTTLFTLIVGLCLRLKQAVLQPINQLMSPVQLLLILVYVRAGEKLWGAPPIPLSVSALAHDFTADPKAFMLRFGWTGIHAATAWALSVPFILAAVFFPVRRALRLLAASLKK
jgi:hypothetical protein